MLEKLFDKISIMKNFALFVYNWFLKIIRSFSKPTFNTIINGNENKVAGGDINIQNYGTYPDLVKNEDAFQELVKSFSIDKAEHIANVFDTRLNEIQKDGSDFITWIRKKFKAVSMLANNSHVSDFIKERNNAIILIKTLIQNKNQVEFCKNWCEIGERLLEIKERRNNK